MIETCAPEAFAGDFLVSTLKSPESQAWRTIGESVDPSRPITRSVEANSGSNTRSRLSSTPASSWISLKSMAIPRRLTAARPMMGSRTAQINPSPLESPPLAPRIGPARIDHPKRLHCIAPGCALATPTGLPHQETELIGVVTIRFDREVRAAPNKIAVADQELAQEGNRIGLGVGLDHVDVLTRETMVRDILERTRPDPTRDPPSLDMSMQWRAIVPWEPCSACAHGVRPRGASGPVQHPRSAGTRRPSVTDRLSRRSSLAGQRVCHAPPILRRARSGPLRISTTPASAPQWLARGTLECSTRKCRDAANLVLERELTSCASPTCDCTCSGDPLAQQAHPSHGPSARPTTAATPRRERAGGDPDGHAADPPSGTAGRHGPESRPAVEPLRTVSGMAYLPSLVTPPFGLHGVKLRANYSDEYMAQRRTQLDAFYELHEVVDEGERLFLKLAFEAGSLSEENGSDLLAAHRAGSQRTYDTLVEAETSRPATPGRALVTRINTGASAERQRAEVLSRHLTRVATTDQGVRMYRRSLLGAPTAVLPPAFARRLLRWPALSSLSWDALRNKYGTRADRWPVPRHPKTQNQKPRGRRVLIPNRVGHAEPTFVQPQSFLDILDEHARFVGESFAWSSPDTAWFLLTGEVPILQPVVAETALHFQSENLPTRAQITVKALPHVSPESVRVAFAMEQRRLTGHRKGREIEPRNLALVDFVGELIAEVGEKPSPTRLMVEWNRRQRAAWRYKHPSKMMRDYKANAPRAFLLEIDAKSGLEPCSLDILERILTRRPAAPSFFTEDNKS